MCLIKTIGSAILEALKRTVMAKFIMARAIPSIINAPSLIQNPAYSRANSLCSSSKLNLAGKYNAFYHSLLKVSRNHDLDAYISCIDKMGTPIINSLPYAGYPIKARVEGKLRD